MALPTKLQLISKLSSTGALSGEANVFAPNDHQGHDHCWVHVPVWVTAFAKAGQSAAVVAQS